MPKTDQHAMDHTCVKGVVKTCKIIPGSSKCVKFVPVHQKKLPKGRHVTYLEDAGILCWLVGV